MLELEKLAPKETSQDFEGTDKFKFRDTIEDNDNQIKCHISIELVISRLLSLAYPVAACTDICLAVENDRLIPNKLNDLPLFLPSNLLLTTEALEALIVYSDTLDACGDLSPVYTLSGRLKLATRLSLSEVQIANNSNNKQSYSLVEAWRATANGLVMGLILCQHLQARNKSSSCNLEHAVKLLEAVLNGEYPCVESKSDISIPEWAERRREKRFTCEVPVRVRSKNAQQFGILRNYSRNGLGIAGCDVFAPNQKVSIGRSDGAVITGIVRWIQNGRLGVQLDDPIKDDDPLFANPNHNQEI